MHLKVKRRDVTKDVNMGVNVIGMVFKAMVLVIINLGKKIDGD